MDALLNQRWQDELSPFDRDCIVTDDLISVEELHVLLGVFVSDLAIHYFGQRLYAIDDWHQHDGYVTERRVTDWPSLTAVFQSAQTLITSRQGDCYVHRSYYPEDLSFLMGYDVPDEESGDGPAFPERSISRRPQSCSKGSWTSFRRACGHT